MIHFYHPNKAVKGSAASFWYSQSNNSVFAQIMKQSCWDTAADNGVFKDNSPAMKVTIKLSQTEVAAILDCVERNRPFTTHHDFGDNPKNISFVPTYDKTDTTKQIGYDFSFLVMDKTDSTKKESFFIRFKLAEARLIRELLIHFLHKQFDSVNKFTENRSNSEPQEVPAAEETTGSDPLTGL